jgi:hypothetical protein
MKRSRRGGKCDFSPLSVVNPFDITKEISRSGTSATFPLKGFVFFSCFCALTEHYAMKVHWGSGGMDSRILDLGTRWR